MSEVTLALLKSELSLATDSEDSYLQTILDGVENWIDTEWGVLLTRQTVEEALFGASRVLWPSKVPVASVTSVEVDGSAISSDAYTLRGNAIVHDSTWDDVYYDVAYAAGYSSVPAAVQSLILSLCRRRYDGRGGVAAESAAGHRISWQPFVDTDEQQLLASLAGGPPC